MQFVTPFFFERKRTLYIGVVTLPLFKRMTLTEDSNVNHNDKIVKQKVTGQQTIFPLARVKKIAKHIPNVTLIAPEVIVAMSYVTEKFIEILAEEAFKNASTSSRKTVTRKDIDAVIESSLPFQILEDCIDDLEELEKINAIQNIIVDGDGDDDAVVMEGSNDNDDITIVEEELSDSAEIIE